MSNVSHSERKTVAGLDIVRFAAALIVVSFHLGLWCFLDTDTYIGTSHGAFGRSLNSGPLLPLASVGWIGVPVFFVLSGYVIAYSANGASVYKYIESRFLRLVPAAVICASISAAIFLIGHLYPVTLIAHTYIKSLIFYPFAPWIDGVRWTLPIEIDFYCLVALFLATNSLNKLEAVLIVVGAISSAAWFLHYSVHHFPAAYTHHLGLRVGGFQKLLDSVLTNRVSELTLLVHGAFFATGVVLWAAAREGFTPLRIGALALFSLGALGYISAGSAVTPTMIVPTIEPYAIYIGSVLFMIFSIKFDRYFPHRYVREIGLITYPLYLTHNVVGSFLFGHILINYMPAKIAAWVAALGCLAIVVVFVRPAERKLRDILKRAIAMISGQIKSKGLAIRLFSRPSSLIH